MKVLTIIHESGESIKVMAFLRMLNELLDIRKLVFVALNNNNPLRKIP